MPDTKDILSEIERCLLRGHAALWGVADVGLVQQQLTPESDAAVPEGLNCAVVFAVRLLDEVLEGLEDRPTPLYFHHYRQVNFLLDRTGLEVATIIQEHGFRSLAVPATQSLSRNPMRGLLSHKILAWAAGLGWIGRNNLLVTPQFGARVRLASVLTDAPLESGRPAEGGCGECRACVEACPAGAIGSSAKDFDLPACEEMLGKFAGIPFVGQHICGVCVKACRGKSV